MSHDMIAYVSAGGKGFKKVTCDQVSEAQNGVQLIDKQDGRQVIGYVPYDNLAYVGPNEE